MPQDDTTLFKLSNGNAKGGDTWNRGPSCELITVDKVRELLAEWKEKKEKKNAIAIISKPENLVKLSLEQLQKIVAIINETQI